MHLPTLPRTLPLFLLLTILSHLQHASTTFCPECGVTGYFYQHPFCLNITYIAPNFGADAGACFEIGGAYSPFGEEALCRSVEIDYANTGCEVFFYPNNVCTNGTQERVRVGQCASDLRGWGSYCVTCPAGSPVLESGQTCPPS